MNKIAIYFTLCSPSNDYKIYYRVAGSDSPYILAGTFYSSPAIFYDKTNPAGTCYEGYIVSDCGDTMGNHIAFETCNSNVLDNSSCNTSIEIITPGLGYENLGLTDLHIEGSTSVRIDWATFDRPNRFTIYEDGNLLITTDWKGYAPYAGPWGTFLSTAEGGNFSFNPVPGRLYQLLIEVGPAGPHPYDVSDNFTVGISCFS